MDRRARVGCMDCASRGICVSGRELDLGRQTLAGYVGQRVPRGPGRHHGTLCVCDSEVAVILKLCVCDNDVAICHFKFVPL